MWRIFGALLIAAGVLQCQTKVDLGRQGVNIDFTGAVFTKPLQSGASLPGTCAVQQLFWLTTATAGQNLYGCTATNTWTLEGGSGAGCTPGGGANSLQTNNGSGGCQGNASDTLDTSGNESIRGSLTTDNANPTDPGTWSPSLATVSNLSTTCSGRCPFSTGSIREVSDATSTSDCTVGGSTFKAVCKYNGATWDPVTGTGGAAFNPADFTTVYWREDFAGDLTNDGFQDTVFRYFTAESNTGVSPNSIITTGGIDHSYVFGLKTGATSGNDEFLSQNRANSGNGGWISGLNTVSGGRAWEINFIFKIVTTATVGVKAGLVANASDTSDTYVDGMFWRYSTNAGDTTFKIIGCAASTCTTVDSTVTASAGWYKIRLYSSTSGQFSADILPSGGSVTTKTVSTNLPSAALQAAASIKTYANATPEIDWNAIEFDITGLTRP
jgi:hypothetical protein